MRITITSLIRSCQTDEEMPWNLTTSSYLQNPSQLLVHKYMAGAFIFACGHVNITLNKVISIYWCNSDAKLTSHPAQIKRKWPHTCREEGCLAAVVTFLLAASLLMWSCDQKGEIFAKNREKLLLCFHSLIDANISIQILYSWLVNWLNFVLID